MILQSLKQIATRKPLMFFLPCEAVTETFRQALDDIWQVIVFSLANSHALFAVCKSEFPRCEDEKSCGNTIPQFLLPQLLANFPNSCVFLQNCMLITYSKKSKFVWENLFWICIGLVFDRLKHLHCNSFWFCFILFLVLFFREIVLAIRRCGFCVN